MSLIVTLAFAAATSNVPAPAAGKSLQQEFDAASAAEAAGDCKTAIPLFEALEQRPAVKPGSLPAATIAVRKGKCLIREGRTSDGEAAIAAGLPRLIAAGADLKADVATAYQSLGYAAYDRSDFAQAKENFLNARAQQVRELNITILAGLIKAVSFDPGPEPLAYADEGIGLAATTQPRSKNLEAAFHSLKGRILLNRGETEAAFAEHKTALTLSGGLTSQTTLDEAAMRGNLALAALLLGSKDDARKYMAYTGAGRISASPFASGVSMSPPECGEETGLRPEDFAVVEFGLAEDGSVSYASTVYSLGGPAVAAAFARAVKEWYWQPEALAKIPVFYRAATRLELRCTTAGGPAPGLMKPLIDRFGQWAMPLLNLPEGQDRSEMIATLRRKIGEMPGQGDTPQIAAAGLLAIADPRINAETVTMIDSALASTAKAPVPTEAVNTLRILRLASSPFAKVRGSNTRLGRFDRQSIVSLLQDPAVSRDPIAANTLRLMADAKQTGLAREAADDQRLPSHHPLRQLALLTLANQAAAAGDLAGAQTMFARTGLTEQQCALIGPKPTLRRTGANSSDFPQEAMMYGFEGWVRLEFDILADGKTANARSIIAYPPFVFVDAAKGMTRDVLYEASFRPAGGPACSANGETIRFILP